MPKKRLLELIRPSPNSIFEIYNPYGLELLNRSRLGLNEFNEDKLKRIFNDIIIPIYICAGDTETINNFFLSTALNTVKKGKPFLTTSKALIKRHKSKRISLTRLLLYGNTKWSLLNCVPYVLTCQCAFRADVLTCQRAFCAYMLTCQRALRAYVLTCQHVLHAQVPTWLACFACIRAHVLQL